MNKFWWQLPGPNSFLNKIINDIRDGRNVILCLPEHLPAGMDYGIRNCLDESERFSWCTIKIENNDSPYEKILSFFGLRDAITIGNQFEYLCNVESFMGRVIWLQNLNEINWVFWKDFLIQYEQACRSVPLIKRTIFLVPLVGKICKKAPEEDVCLSKRKWYGVVDSFDMLIFVNEMLREKEIPHLLKKLTVSVISSISLWDPKLASYFMNFDNKYIFKPNLVLEEYAKEMKWTADTNRDLSYGWDSGKINLIDGERKLHSAVLAINKDYREISKRIWNAEIGIMFPFVEERRQEILTILKDVLYVPFKTRFGEIIDDWKDLEIGHIEKQISSDNIPVSYELKRLISVLREIRNSLSHLEPLELSTLHYIESSNFVNLLKT